MIRTVAILLALTACMGGAQEHRLPNGLDALVSEGISALMHDRFSDADSIFRLASDMYQDHPAGPVMRCAVAHLTAEEMFADVDSRLIDSLLVVAELRGSRYGLDDESGRLALSFISSARGIVSMVAAREGAWIKAIQYALQATSLGEDIIGEDSSLADAGLAVGNYYYWKSRRVEVLTWLPFVEDSRNEGIVLLRRCARQGIYQKYAAINSLAWILTDAGKHEEAITWVERGLHDFPENRALLRTYADALQHSGDTANARRTWEAVLHSLEHNGQSTSWAAYKAVIKILQLSERNGETDSMLEWMGELENVERNLDRSMLTERRRSLIEDARQLKEDWNTMPDVTSDTSK